LIANYGYIFLLVSRALEALERKHRDLRRQITSGFDEELLRDLPRGQDDPSMVALGQIYENPQYEASLAIFPATVPYFKRLRAMMLKGISFRDSEQALSELRNRFEDDLQNVLFFRVDPAYRAYYGNNQAFGGQVASILPSAGDDIESAGQCLALGQGTAAVFHLMRVMEVGLRALGGLLGIPYAPSWESYLRQINANVSADHKTKPPEWKRDEAVFKEILGDLIAIKTAWRNPTMHVTRRYSQEEAAQIYQAVRLFISRLVTKLPLEPS